MNRFSKPKLKDRLSGSFSISVIIFVAVIGVFLFGISSISGSSVANDKQLLEDAVQRDIIHCYSVEGSYPENVAYMESHYGLTYDKNKFIIDYEYIGANIMPQVQIINKQGK